MPVSGSRSSRCSPLGSRIIGGEPDLDVQVGALAVHELLQPRVEFGNDRVCRRTTSSPSAPCLLPPPRMMWSRRRPAAARFSPCIGRDRLGLQSEVARFRAGDTYVARLRRGRRSACTRPSDRRAARSVSRRIGGREPASMPSSRPRWIAHTSSRCSSSRSRNGQSRRVMSTRVRPRRRKRGSNPASARASCSDREVRARRGTRARPRRGASHEVRAPLASGRPRRARAAGCR